MTSSERSGLTVAVDIGGTFTDVALLDAVTGQIWRAKTPSVPGDPSRAFMAGVNLALEEAGRASESIDRALHGTTVATNMILEGKGARAVLVTTRGFRHVLTIGRQDIPRAANLYSWIKPARPVPASRVLEVDERIGPGGQVIEALNDKSVAKAIESCRRLGAEAVAICLLHSFANPTHERHVADMMRAALPGVAVTASSDVLPVAREFERSLATVLNASVMPGVSTYISRLEDRLKASDVAAPLLLMQSNGGVAGAQAIRRAPALTALSGPAAGVVGARSVAEACDIRDIITIDIGGTSADICLIKDGAIGLTQKGQIGNWPLPLPMVDMVTIGAGGGSIATVQDGALTVGPKSAGADPGPASYGRGGRDATVTDAHVVLGHLQQNLLGGRMKLDFDAARAAIEATVAKPLGVPVESAARGMLAIVDSNMVGALRIVSVERGHDPRTFTLVAFGGAGPLHGCALADLLQTPRVLIPPAPGVLCADGLLVADLKAEFSRTLPNTGRVEIAQASKVLDELSKQADDWLASEGVAPTQRAQLRVGLMRYHGQGGEVTVPLDGVDDAATAENAFETAHEKLYGFRLEAGIELVTLRVEAAGRHPAPRRESLPAGRGPRAYAHGAVHFEEGEKHVPIFNRDALGAGDQIPGPALITQLDTTTLVPSHWNAEMHGSGALLLMRKG